MSVQTVPEANFSVRANPSPQDRSLGELFGDLSRETAELVRQEVRLAKTEVTRKAVGLGKDAAMIAGGATVAGVGFLALTAALVCGLAALIHSDGAAALIVGLLYVIAGGLFVWQGIAGIKRVDPVPHETLETLKEDGQWLKNIRK